MRLFLILTVALLATPLTAQQTIKGIVTDALTGEPLSFVHVFLENDQSYGVITNDNGEYRIQLTEDQIAENQLVFSLMSYKTHFEPLAGQPVEQGYFNLKMHSTFFELEEVVVTSDLGLRNIVQKALDRIPQNYGTEKYLVRAYAREYSITDTAYSYLEEAMVTYEDTPYEKPDKKVKGWIDQIRGSDDNRDRRFRGGPDDVNQYLHFFTFQNSVRNHWIHWVSSVSLGSKLASQTFSNRGEYLSGKDTLIRIRFGLDLSTIDIDSATYSIIDNLFEGELLINKTDYAILRITVGNPKTFHYSDVVYQKQGSKYYPHRINRVYNFRYNDQQNYHLGNKLIFVYQVITDREGKKAYKKGRRMLEEKKVLPKDYPFNPAFWEENAILLQIPAPEALANDLSRSRSLSEQFRANARRVIE